MLCGIFVILGLAKGTLQPIYLLFTYNKKGAPKTLFISCYIIVKKVTSSFRRKWLHQKVIHDVSIAHYDFLVCAHSDFL